MSGKRPKLLSADLKVLDLFSVFCAEQSGQAMLQNRRSSHFLRGLGWVLKKSIQEQSTDGIVFRAR